jgi:hypothetical protein
MLAICCGSFAVAQNASGQMIDTSMATGTSGKSQRAAAAARIPHDQLDPAVSQKVAEVVRKATIYRQLPVTTINSDPDLYLTLLRYPEVIISTWQLMGVTQMNAARVAPFTMQVADGAGTTTRTDLIYGDPTLNVFYSEGEYDGPMLFRKITGKCVIIVESLYQADVAGQTSVTSRLNIFLQIDNMAAGLIARTIHPLVGTTADDNFVETLKFAEKLAATTEKNGPGVQRMGERLNGLQPDVRQRFIEVAGVAWQRAIQRQQPEINRRTVQTGYTQTGYTQTGMSPPGR